MTVKQRKILTDKFKEVITVYVASFPNMTDKDTTSIEMLAERLIQVTKYGSMRQYRNEACA